MAAINKSNITAFVYMAQFDWLAVVLFNVNLFFTKVLICAEFLQRYNVSPELVLGKRIINSANQTANIPGLHPYYTRNSLFQGQSSRRHDR